MRSKRKIASILSVVCAVALFNAPHVWAQEPNMTCPATPWVHSATPLPAPHPAEAAAGPAEDLAKWKIPPRPLEELAPLGDLEDMDKMFTRTYSKTRDCLQYTLGPIILLRLSGATLFRDGKIVETQRIIPAEYFNLRYASHVPFAIFLRLQPLAGTNVTPELIQEIQAYTAAIEKGALSLDQTKLRPDQLERQHRLLSHALAFLSSVRAEPTVDLGALVHYVRSESVDIEQNIREAGAAQVDGVHAQLLSWRRQIPDSEWRNVRFVVHGPQQPRGGNAATTYLAALVQDAGDGRGYVGESDRVVFREDTSLPGGTQGPPWANDLQLLAAINLDSQASEAIFVDPDRLAVDIAADGARRRVREMDFSALRFNR